MRRILLTGTSGQVGYELARSLHGLGDVVAPGRAAMDLADLAQVRDVIRSLKPDLIVNPAAYTAVDMAESEPQLALRINAEAPGVMAEEARRLGAALIHYSTDYVFDGSKVGAYTEQDAPCPVSVYGRTKLAGEQAIEAAGVRHLILRTSWVYGLRGKNFLRTVLRLAQERGELRIVADQFGAPTWSRTIAEATARIVGGGDWNAESGIYHLTAKGRTSWHGFAEAILANARLAKPPLVMPIASAGYPTPARRPTNSVLSQQRYIDAFGELPAWDAALKCCQG